MPKQEPRSHYFEPSPDTPHRKQNFCEEVVGKKFYFLTDSDTFSRKSLDFGSRLLLETSLEQLDFAQGERVLDLGCGWGPVGIVLQAFHPELKLSFSDVNERALELARENYRANIKHKQADFVQSDGLEKLTGSFNKIFLNPPIRAGKQVIFRLFNEAYEALLPGGELLIVIRKKQGADSTRKELERLFGSNQVEDIARKAGYRVLRSGKAEETV
ncbi:MAG: methyltransferase [Eubacteriales bacterium]|nr:methyltransferase [Eubacteriales bacterium]